MFTSRRALRSITFDRQQQYKYVKNTFSTIVFFVWQFCARWSSNTTPLKLPDFYVVRFKLSSHIVSFSNDISSHVEKDKNTIFNYVQHKYNENLFIRFKTKNECNDRRKSECKSKRALNIHYKQRLLTFLYENNKQIIHFYTNRTTLTLYWIPYTRYLSTYESIDFGRTRTSVWLSHLTERNTLNSEN